MQTIIQTMQMKIYNGFGHGGGVKGGYHGRFCGPGCGQISLTQYFGPM